MAKKALFLVESLAKAKTFREHLGEHNKVLASYGQIQDLYCNYDKTTNRLSVNYQAIEKNKKRIQAIQFAAKKADTIYIATNPDDEGEALAWQLNTLLQPLNKTIKRIFYREITKLALTATTKKSSNNISMDQVNTYQAQRTINHLINHHLSSLVATKIHREITLDHHQSAILSLITQREASIDAFIPVDYWQIQATLDAHGQQLSADLTHYDGLPIEQLSITNKEFASTIQLALINDAKNSVIVSSIDSSSYRKTPPEPFNTVDLLSTAAEKIGFSLQRTLRTAQQLYDGVNTPSGRTGFISYYHTQTKTLCCQMKKSICAEIVSQFNHETTNADQLNTATQTLTPNESRAIHPTDIQLTPKSLKKHLSADQYKLYDLIWKRALASQMTHAEFTITQINFTRGNHQLTSNFTEINRLGFMVLDKTTQETKTKHNAPPQLTSGESISLEKVQVNQRSTEVEPRHTELSLIKILSQHKEKQTLTYIGAIASLQDAGYATVRQKQFYPTDMGIITSQFITQYLPQLTNGDFSMALENTLDSIPLDNTHWQDKITRLWTPLFANIKKAAQLVDRKDITQEATDEQCPLCSNTLIIRLGRLGRFVGCKSYPKCDYTRSLGNAPSNIADEGICPSCQSNLVAKQGKFGEFIGCSTFPNCRYIEPKDKPEATQVACPECQGGEIVKRQSRSGSTFYSCQCYPDCTYAIWHPPIAENCPSCHWPILTIKTTRNKKIKKVCPQVSCHFSVAYTL